MANLFGDNAQFIWTVLSHWQAYMTGGIVMAAMFVYERLTQKTVSVRVVIGGIIAFLLVAFFMAWRDQNKQLERVTKDLERTKQDLDTERKKVAGPELKGRIEMTSFGYNPNLPEVNGTIAIVASIRNTGAPSIVELWDCSVAIPGKGTINGRPVAIS